MSRGRLRIVCNLSADPVTVPVTGDVALAWGEPTVSADSTVLEGHSVAVLRCIPNTRIDFDLSRHAALALPSPLLTDNRDAAMEQYMSQQVEGTRPQV